jgi:hypothetical protein
VAGALLGGVDGAGDLERWAADARAREAADARVRERWLRAQASEEASLAGVLLALAERRETVVVTTSTGRRHRGVVTGVGVDFVVVEVPAGTSTLVVLAAVGDVRVAAEDGGPASRVATTGASSSDRAGTSDDGLATTTLGVRLGDVLAQAAGQRPRVTVHAGTTSVVGELRAMGGDVLTLRTDGDARAVYVPLASLSEVSFLASG